MSSQNLIFTEPYLHRAISSRNHVFTEPSLHRAISSQSYVFIESCSHETMSSLSHVFMKSCLNGSMSSRNHVCIESCLHRTLSSQNHVFMKPCLHETMLIILSPDNIDFQVELLHEQLPPLSWPANNVWGDKGDTSCHSLACRQYCTQRSTVKTSLDLHLGPCFSELCDHESHMNHCEIGLQECPSWARQFLLLRKINHASQNLTQRRLTFSSQNPE